MNNERKLFTEEPKISDLQRRVLAVLGEYFSCEANCVYIRYIAKEAGVDYRQARIAVRALARKGLAEYVRGLFHEDGTAAGSGYCATLAGALITHGCHDKALCGNVATTITGECTGCYEKRRVYTFVVDWGKYKKGDVVTEAALGSDFKQLYWGTEKKHYKDKKIVNTTPTPPWCCQVCEHFECICKKTI